jgi:hypothetical protein
MLPCLKVGSLATEAERRQVKMPSVLNIVIKPNNAIGATSATIFHLFMLFILTTPPHNLLFKNPYLPMLNFFEYFTSL